ncbi:MAG: hypothetical protein ACSLE6_00870 [Mycobacterium sp.]
MGARSAAELLDLALGLGGDTAERRIDAARHHVNAGGHARAGALLEGAIDRLDPGSVRAQALNQLAAVSVYRDSYHEGLAVVERGLDDVGDNDVLRARMLITKSTALLNTREPGGRR